MSQPVNDTRPIKIVEITPEVFVMKDEICSMEFEDYEACDYYASSRRGTVMTLKNGRKIYVGGKTPREITDILNKYEEPK